MKFFDPAALKRIDWPLMLLVLILMTTSLMILASVCTPYDGLVDRHLSVSHLMKNQLRAFLIGIFTFVLIVCIDYRKFREMTWIFYAAMILLLLGLFFMPAIHNVRRWYHIPGIGFDVQPSEYAKIGVILSLAWMLEKFSPTNMGSIMRSAIVVFIPFVLILKQPDLGTALVLGPICLSMLYMAGCHKKYFRLFCTIAILLLSFILLIFLQFLSHEEMKDFFLGFMKEYQYERLNPNTYHQKAGQIAISLGSIFGSGWGKSEFTGAEWLPYAYTDSVFPAFCEEFGLFGAAMLLLVFLALIYRCLRIIKFARDEYTVYVSSGIACMIAIHVIINISMMAGYLPITGVPLILITYGGSSVMSTLIALGILQGIYARRYS
jgi:rod shape determining protein RodA